MRKVTVMANVSPKCKDILVENGFEVNVCESSDEDVIAKSAFDSEAILFASTKFTNSLFDKLPNLKIISRHGIGIDTVDMDAATAHGVIVCNSSAYGTYDVAEHTVALILSFIHRIPTYDNAIKSKNDWSFGSVPKARRISEMKIGIVGFGRISRWICKMLSGFDVEISVYDPYADENEAKALGVKVVSLDELLKENDIISLNAPLNSSTYHMISDESIAKMKDGVIIVNTGRGALVDEKALIRALEEGKVGGAALDVFENEPFESDSKFRTLDNVVLTPHIAWNSVEAVRDLTYEVTGNIIDYFNGLPLRNQLNLK